MGLLLFLSLSKQSLFKLLPVLLVLSCSLKTCSAPNDNQVVFVPVNHFCRISEMVPKERFSEPTGTFFQWQRKICMKRSGSAKSKHDDPGGFGTNFYTPLSLTSETLEMRSARVKLCWVAPPPPPPRSIFSAMEASWARLSGRTLTTFLFFSVANPGCLSRIPDPTFFHPGSQIRAVSIPDPNCLHPGSRIPDPHQRI